MYQVIIIGGGLGGLLTAILLGRAGISTLVIEKKIYPFHKVCGEYISNEVTSYLHSIGLFPLEFSPPKINRLQISSNSGKISEIALPMGGFGISRFRLDHFWYLKAVESGVKFKLDTSASSILYKNGLTKVLTNQGTSFEAQVVIGAFGKRSLMDKHLNRTFMRDKSGYVGIKYHIKHPWEPGLIALHGFDQGYCGISMIEEEKLNLCYLSNRSNLRIHGDIDSLEKNVLSKNPFLASILASSERLFAKPLVINEISFAPKKVIENHILMIGDAAGMITPLCGNGMAMAIHSAKILAPRVTRFFQQKSYVREQMEDDYKMEWHRKFSRRLLAGRYLQSLFHHKLAAEVLVQVTRIPCLAQWMVRQTHGVELEIRN